MFGCGRQIVWLYEMRWRMSQNNKSTSCHILQWQALQIIKTQDLKMILLTAMALMSASAEEACAELLLVFLFKICIEIPHLARKWMFCASTEAVRA